MSQAQYEPEELAKAFAIRGQRLVLLAEWATGLDGWEETRRVIYEYVYQTANLSAGMMLFRALELARREGEITRDYFLMTDAEAFSYLITECNRKTRELMERINRWMFYPRMFNYRSADVSERVGIYISDSGNRNKLADDISVALEIPPEDVCIYMGRDKGFKRIHLPIVGDGDDKEHQPRSKNAYMVQGYLHPKWQDKREAMREIIEAKLI